MDKETLSNYGWIVICVLVLAVMIALATPFGSFVSEAVQSTTQGLFDVNQSALNSTGLINIGDQSFGDGGNGGSGETGTETPSEPEETPTDPEPTECQHTNTTTINTSSATCTVAGYTGDTYCNDCKTTTATGTSIPATNHKNTTIINASSATCTATGYTGDTYCNDCKTTTATGTSIPATNHQNTTTINASATYTGDTYCNDCKTTIATGETISQYQLSGTWKFNDQLSSPNFGQRSQQITFTSGSKAFDSIYLEKTNAVSVWMQFGDIDAYDNLYDSGWTSEVYKTVDFGTVSQEVSQEFYEWFTANATKIG